MLPLFQINAVFFFWTLFIKESFRMLIEHQISIIEWFMKHYVKLKTGKIAA